MIHTARGAALGAFVFLICLFVLSAEALAARPPAAAVATAHPLATEAAEQILHEGGNAFDAAIAAAAALAVVEPYGSGIGGGGFWLLHRAEDGRQVFLDGRETAPAAAHEDMYVGEDGEVDPEASLVGPLAAGIPGTPAALAHLAEHYGELPLATSLAPAIRLAREGFPVNEHYRQMALARLKELNRFPAARSIFLHDQVPPPEGHQLRQPELARTLERLAAHGFDGFYRGEVAEQLVSAVQRAGGIWTAEDLSGYEVVEREPVVGEYRGIRVVSAPPPSAGGIGLITMLGILSHYELERLTSVERTHLIVEAMRRAYRDRAEYLGDPAYVDIPQERLLNPEYAAGLRQSIRRDRATDSAALRPAVPEPSLSESTTHFSILDAEGNRVAATLTINYPFGSAFVAEGTGVLLNNEMDDFASQPGAPNVYGLVGSTANAIAPGKRPLSSMSPTFLETEDRVAILGTPGGSRIVTMVLLGALEFAAGREPQAWVDEPRFHHQYLPDEIQHEPTTFDGDTRRQLRELGHELNNIKRPYGDMQAILWDRARSEVQAASDPRGAGTARVLKK